MKYFNSGPPVFYPGLHFLFPKIKAPGRGIPFVVVINVAGFIRFEQGIFLSAAFTSFNELAKPRFIQKSASAALA